MFILNQSDLFEFDLNKSTDFINFWSNFYNYSINDETTCKEINYFEELNICQELSEINIKRLLRWKDPKYLSGVIKSGNNQNQINPRITKVMECLDDINKFRNSKIDEKMFDTILNNCFPYGNGIWNIFIKHIACPISFPIYDQHVYRSFCWHKKESEKNIKNNYNAYKEYFFSIYGNTDIILDMNTIHNMKKVDNALMVFGQFLSKYGKSPKISFSELEGGKTPMSASLIFTDTPKSLELE